VNVTRRRWAATLGLVMAVLAACAPSVSPLDATLGAGILTPEVIDSYGLAVSNNLVTATAAPNNVGVNTRVAFWQLADQASSDQQSCATWVDARGNLQQPGAALRVRQVNGRTSAITITNNIFFGARWAFNVHVMDSGASPQFHQIASFDLSSVFRPNPANLDMPPYPWRMCARVVGSTVSFVVWPVSHAEPAWDDPRYGGSVTLPAGWGHAGMPGWYIGHLGAGDSAGFADMSTALVTPEPPPTTTTTSTTLPPTTTTTTVPPPTTTTVGEPPPAGRAPGPSDPSDGTVSPEPTTPARAPTWIPVAP
jgi:hypothetical protein